MESNTEHLILETAKNHFHKKGFAGTRMQDIADDAGINKALLHYYFRSKEKLYREIIKQLLNQVIPIFVKAFSENGSFLERIDRVIETYIDLLRDNPHIPFFVMTELTMEKDSFIEEVLTHSDSFPAVGSLLHQMEEDMNEGLIKKYPPLQLMLNIIGMCVFPFMTKPILQTIFHVNEENFNKEMEQRKTLLKKFINDALKPG